VPTGRIRRLGKIGHTATRVGARHAVQRIREAVTPSADHAGQRKRAMQRTAHDVVGALAELKGAAMKVGQMLSVDPHVLPPDLREALTALQRSVPPMPFSMVEEVVGRAFQRPLAQVFASMDPEPLGAASIGQVHRAVSLEGRPLAVKVQYPGVEGSIDDDVRNVGSLLNITRLVAPGVPIQAYMEELRQALHREADYTQEAQALEHYGPRFSSLPSIRCPRPVHDLTRKTVLSMDLLDGTPLDKHLVSLPQAERDALATRWLDFSMRCMHELHLLHADPHPGNFLVDPAGNIVILDFGCVREFDPAFTDAMVEIMRAVWRGDAEVLPGLLARMGFGVPGAKPPGAEVTYEWLELTLAPFLRDEPFDFPAWQPERRARTFVFDHPEILTLVPPRAAMFYFRVVAGIRGLLARTGSRVNVHRLAKAIERRVREPSGG
jgi:predicted unusual protein kinase regulating ubiquinone biosynthesis (AarF/ABC1/UbiB family)